MRKVQLRKLGFIFTSVIALAFSSGVARAADEYPNKPIQLIVPYGPGGLTDIIARLVAEKMGKILGQPVVVVNKTGASTSIGSALVASSKPDGYTMLINMTGGIVVTPLIVPYLSYRTSDLKPIGKVASTNYLVIANQDLPVNSLAELIAQAKKDPNKLAYASPGVGTVNHITLEQQNFEHQLGMQHIPYTSEMLVLNALLGGHVHVAAVTTSFSLKFLQANKVKALAILAEKRSPVLPDVSTSAEQGFPEILASLYNIMFVPAKTPAPIVKRLEDALQKTLQDKEVVGVLNKMELTIDFMNSVDTQAFLDSEVERWAAAVKKANVTNN